MQIVETKIADVKLIKPVRHIDAKVSAYNSPNTIAASYGTIPRSASPGRYRPMKR